MEENNNKEQDKHIAVARKQSFTNVTGQETSQETELQWKQEPIIVPT